MRIRGLSKKTYMIVATSAVATVTLVAALSIMIVNNNRKKQLLEIEKNVQYVDSLSKQDINTIQDKISKIEEDKIKKEEQQKEEEQKKKQQEKAGSEKSTKTTDDSVDINYKTTFKDTAFMGDSITEGLGEYNILNKYNVFSNKGDTVIKAMDYANKVIGSHPRNVVLLYGMNDLVYFSSPNNGPEQFRDKYIDLINKLKSGLPTAKIYIQAPLPVMDSITVKNNANINSNNISKFREMVKEVCGKTGATYLDVPAGVEGHDELHEKDGIHFKYNFYKMWLNGLVKKIK